MIGGLIRVHISSIVNEVIKTISSQFFLRILNSQKLKSNQNQLTKQKQGRKKQQRQQVLAVQKLLRGWKPLILHFGAFCMLKIFSLKKKETGLKWS